MRKGNRKKVHRRFYLIWKRFGRRAFFARNSEVIKNDIDFTLAISQKKHHGNRLVPKWGKKTENQAKGNRPEIDKLKKEMGKLNNRISKAPRSDKAVALINRLHVLEALARDSHLHKIKNPPVDYCIHGNLNFIHRDIACCVSTSHDNDFD